MLYAAIAVSVLFVVVLIALNVRSNGWRNRRKSKRREVPDRRVNVGRRKRNEYEHHSSLPDRRKEGDRRTGPVTRRHKKRRSEDRLGRN